jgi:hypothetical protein
MSVDLRTTYLGLGLRNPIVAAASPLTGDLGALRRMEEAGAAAVLPSLFQEQLERDALAVRQPLTAGPEGFERILARLPELDDYNTGSAGGGRRLRRIPFARHRGQGDGLRVAAGRAGPVGPVALARPGGPHGGPPSPRRSVPIPRRRGFRRRGNERSSIRSLAAVIETASNRQAWSLSRIGPAGSRASVARASTSLARRSAGLVAASGGSPRPGSFLSSLS